LRDQGWVRLVEVLKVFRLQVFKFHEVYSSDNLHVAVHTREELLNRFSLLFHNQVEDFFVNTDANFLTR